MLSRNAEALLMEYAAGSLDHAHRVIVTAYLTLSPAARRFVGECEKIGGALMEAECGEAQLSSGCLDAVLAKIDCGEIPCSEVSATISSAIANSQPVPQCIARLLPGSAEPDWRRFSHGLHWIVMELDDTSSSLHLMKFEPNAVFARHRHRGPEITLVLEGTLRDESGRYSRGDLLVMETGTTHTPMAEEAGCVCFTVTARQTRYTDFWTRLFRPHF